MTAPAEITVTDAVERIERFFEAPQASYGVYREGRVRADLGADIKAVLTSHAELLDALKECALQVAQTHNRRLTTDEQSALDSAKAAIAKATGQ